MRHHSPACARAVRWAIEAARPAWVLIEGPSDFNDRLDELYLEHTLPIAIYSYLRLPSGARRGAYYPFCEYSPEWQALLAARAVGARARFVDLPWADLAEPAATPHRYADAELRQSPYVAALLAKLGHEDFDSLWDELFEADAALPPAELIARCHAFCLHCRLVDGAASEADLRREAFMASEVRRALAEAPGQVALVTGGFHTGPLAARLAGRPFPEPRPQPDPGEVTPRPALPEEERGIALTPYSYERLDALTGYEAGMPGPGFYQRVWQARAAGGDLDPSALLSDVVAAMRGRRQQVSAADAIAVEVTARQLAAVRGQRLPWRRELLDALTGALIKEPLDPERGHPLLDAAHEVLRGDARGVLDARTPLPPLIHDVRRRLAALGLEDARPGRGSALLLELSAPDPAAASRDRERSQALHALRILGIGGFRRLGGTDLATREDLSQVVEEWQLVWTPDRESSLVEASIYGPTLAEAAAARLAERAAALERAAGSAAALLLEASLAGLTAAAARLRAETTRLLAEDNALPSVGVALGHLLYLYRYDVALGTAGDPALGVLLAEAFARGLWLLEVQGGAERAALDAVARLLEVFERCGAALDLEREELVAVLRRVAADPARPAALRGAALGALWTLGEVPAEALLAALRGCAAPEALGDLLSGLFRLAREAAQRERRLLLEIDRVLTGYDDEAFLSALPSFRLAFTGFTPREKHHLAMTVLEATGGEGAAPGPLTTLEVSLEDATRALAFEQRLFASAARYGLRGAEEAGP